MTKIQTFFLPSVIAFCVGCISLPLHAATVADQWRAPTMPATTSVMAGSAPIEQALSTIIPSPYRIELDEIVPATAILVWPAGDNWMNVLRASVAPLGLVVVPDWKANVVRIVHLKADTPLRMPADVARVAEPMQVASDAVRPSRKPLPMLKPGALPVTDTLPPGELPPIGWKAAQRAALSSAKAARSSGRSAQKDKAGTHPLRIAKATPPSAKGSRGSALSKDTISVSVQPVQSVASHWTMHSGELLSAVVTRWCQTADWQTPQWQADVDYPIKADATFNGDLITALTELMESYRHAKEPLHLAIYPPQRVVYVTTLADTEAQ